MEKIEIKIGEEIGVKRFYMPGVLLSFNCRKCGKLMEKDYEQQYISFPTIGEQTEYFYCHECDTEHKMPINLKVSIEFDRNTLKILD